jgi:hypothetical protein
MKNGFILFLMLANLAFSQEPLPLAKFTVMVMDEDQKPIPGAKLKIWSYEDISKDQEIRYKKTDNVGNYLYQGRIWQELSFEVSQKQYYTNWSGMRVTGVKDGKIQEEWDVYDSAPIMEVLK